MLMAIFVPHFAILMGLIGSFTGNMLSLVWPAYFHLRIKGASVGFFRRAIDVLIVLFGLLCSMAEILPLASVVLPGRNFSPWSCPWP